MKNRRIIILGSNSFIAKETINKLEGEKINLVKISRKNINLENNDSIKKLKKIYKKNDKIIFVAAKAPVKNIKMLSENLKICENVLKSLEGVNFNQLLYVSSDAVYSDSKSKITEDSLTVPDSYHGFMHLMRERMLSTFTKKLTIIRPTLVFGNKDPHNGYGPNMFIRNAQSNYNIRLFGKGEERRDHIYVKDVANIIFACLKKNKFGIFNAVSGSVISFYKISQLIKKKYNVKIEFTKRKGPMPHNGYRAFDNKKIQNVLGFKKITSIKDFMELGLRYEK